MKNNVESRKQQEKTMRKTLGTLLVVAVGVFGASAAFAYDPPAPLPGTGINGTVHDLGTAHNNMDYTNPADSSLQRICIFCHAPHNAYRLSPANGGPAAGVGGGPQAGDAFDYLPLWNHTLQTNTAYSMYYAGPGAPATGPHAQQTLGNQVIGGVSLLCLSCHDGSVAVNKYGNTSQPTASRSNGTATIGAAYIVGKDGYLGNHHPIGFSWSVVASDKELRDPTTTPMGAVAAGNVSDHFYSSQVLGATDVMECGTCHSVHNKGNTGESLLWRSDAASRLCLTCHDKGANPGSTP
jgi:predicted CXXCH cytochrome family protein